MIESITTWLLKVEVGHVLSFFIGLISLWLQQAVAEHLRLVKARADKDKLVQAKTPEEKNAAAQSINSDTFGNKS